MSEGQQGAGDAPRGPGGPRGRPGRAPQGGGPGRAPQGGGPGQPRIILLPTAREALATLGASTLSLVTGYLVLFVSDLSGWLAVAMLAAGVALFAMGVRSALALRRHYEEGGRVASSSWALIWVVGALAGGGSLGALLLAGAVVSRGA